MPIQLQFTLTFPDFANAHGLDNRHHWRQRWGHFLNFAFFLGSGIAFLGFAIFDSVKAFGATAVLFNGLAGIVLLCYPMYYRHRLKTIYRHTRVDQGSFKLEFSEDCLCMESSNTKSEIAWGAIRSFSENKNLYLLYLAPAKFIPIPKRVCSAEQLNELRSLFQRRIKPSAK